MSNIDQDATLAFLEFATGMRSLEQAYYARFREVAGEPEEFERAKSEFTSDKKALLSKWCSPRVVAKASFAAQVSDPPRFCPPDDQLTVLESDEKHVLIEYQQVHGLKSKMRFQLVSESGQRMIDKAELFDRVAEKWRPLII
jgi:hypothetical protein